ncbi:hypothetical protein AB0I81_50620 [Nonomuraea sp. NPDC050404]|uniref:hypothetical protein n=1 Tax=Nonomuraea sp. NPDC050404 TaxID=3155783 RepID=UPI0033EFC37C
METHPTCASGVLLCDPVTLATARQQADALDQVVPHLKAKGVHELLIMRSDPQPCAILVYGTNEDLWHQPEMTIQADGGWLVATVTVGERSGSFLVELPRVGPDNEPIGTRTELVPSTLPSRVALLVAEHAKVAA